MGTHAPAEGVKPEKAVLIIHAAWDGCCENRNASRDRDARRLRLTNLALDAYFADD